MKYRVAIIREEGSNGECEVVVRVAGFEPWDVHVGDLLSGRITGAGSAREAGFFNRYRILVEWILLCIEKRRNTLHTAKTYLPVEPHEREDIMCPWVVREVNRRGHYVTKYERVFEVVPCHKDGREIPESKGAYYGDE